MSLFQISGILFLEKRYDAVKLLEGMSHPQVKLWLMANALYNIIICSINGITFI